VKKPDREFYHRNEGKLKQKEKKSDLLRRDSKEEEKSVAELAAWTAKSNHKRKKYTNSNVWEKSLGGKEGETQPYFKGRGHALWRRSKEIRPKGVVEGSQNDRIMSRYIQNKL